MDNSLRLSGFARGEIDPPVPAPRHKRKLITNEDSKLITIEQNTGVSEQTPSIAPPPRRKKLYVLQETNTLLLALEQQQKEIALLKGLDEIQDIRVINLLNNDPVSEIQGTLNNEIFICNNNHSKENILPDGYSPKRFEVSKTHDENKKVLENQVELDDTLVEKENFPSIEIENPAIFGNPEGSDICESQIEDRVVETPVENVESALVPNIKLIDDNIGISISQTIKEENRVTSSVSETSATIVGVFYKPQYIALNKNSNENYNSLGANGLRTVFGLASRVDNGINTSATVPIYETKRGNNKTSAKDSEEDDSGVYFSDTKSPPHREISSDKNAESKSKPTIPESELQFYKHISCNDGDTFDNKSSEDLGPQSYSKMLDYFEAQTVNSFREEIVGRFSVCSGEINKNRAVEDWLDSGDYLSKQKNSKLSEYLRNMLEAESDGNVTASSPSVSPYPLSAVEEDDRSDAGESVESQRDDACDHRHDRAYTVPSSLINIIENSGVDSSNNVDVIVNTTGVNKLVNIDCNKVTLEEIKFLDNDESNKHTCSVKNVFLSSYFNSVNDNGSNQQSVEQDSLGAVNTDQLVPSPAIKHGVVNSLIAYFENIVRQEISIANNNELSKDNETDDCSDVESPNEILCIEKQNSIESDDLTPIKISLLANNYETEVLDVCQKPIKFDYQENYFGQQNDISIDDSYEIAEFHNDGITDNTMMMQNKIGSINAVEWNYEEQIKNTSYILANEATYCGQLIEECNFVLSGTNNSFEDQNIPKEDKTDIAFVTSTDYQLNSEISAYENKNNSCHSLLKHVKEIDDFPNKEFPIPLDIHEDQYKRNESKSNNEESKFSTESISVAHRSSNCSYKPTRIPVVILTEADVSPIGSIELHPSKSPFNENEIDSDIVIESEEKTSNNMNAILLSLSNKDYQGDESLLDTEEVVLEKNWGSIGLKIEGDDQGVVVSDILAGGVADESGLVFKGFFDIKSIQEEVEIFC